MAKIYTKTGDLKTTGILGGFRLSKRSDRIEAIGSLDELNSFIGFLLSLSRDFFKHKKHAKIKASFEKIIQPIQNDLFVIGAELSKQMIKRNSIPHPLHRHYRYDFSNAALEVPSITHRHIHQLEAWIDELQKDLPPLKNFILPQGNSVGAFLQIIRTICRRTERRAVQLAMHSKLNPLTLAYLNRLSDLFFVLARAANYETHQTETLWKSNSENRHRP